MNRLIPVFVFFVMLLHTVSLRAQGITLRYSTSPTVCFNTGYIAVHASGGTGPYTYRIDTGTYYPNFPYPITLVASQDTFFDMPQGTFEVVVIDASHDSASFWVTVGGTYQFPVLTLVPTATGVICPLSLGLRPYSYAISSLSANSGFGPYQSSDTFELCPGTYWVRGQDSCGNIYTDSVDFQYANPLSGNVTCVNYAGGNLIVTASGGHPPYTFTANGVTNHTGVFHGLSTVYNAYVTDSCGTVYPYFLYQSPVYLSETCPFDSSCYYNPLSNVPYFGDTLSFTCTDCSPFQSSTFTGLNTDTVFRHLLPDTVYHFVITTPEGACGVDTLPYLISVATILPTLIYNSCHSFTISPPVGVVVDSYTVYSTDGYVIATNQSGYFFNMPDSAVSAEVFVNSTCTPNPILLVTIPHFFIGNCYTEMMDSACDQGWFIDVYPCLNESYYLIDQGGNTIMPNPVDTFYDLQPSYPYTLLSDSGCHTTINTPSPFIVDAFSSVPCASSQHEIGFYVNPQGGYAYPPIGCPSNFFLKLSNAQSTIYYGDIPININTGLIGPIGVSDTGWYTYQLCLNNMTDSPFVTYDTTCPIATGQVYVSAITIPYPYPNFGYVCYPNSTDSIYYQIYGGSPPYTVEVQGFATDTIYGNNAVFPTYQVGTYTMIVYDDCGISRSIAFNVIDTCSCSLYASIGANAPHYCAGDTVELRSYIPPASIFSWYVNGQLYSVSADTVFTPPVSGFDSIKFVFTAYPGCMDSAYTTIYADTSPYTFLGDDTTYCGAFSVTLQTGNFNTIWSTGATGSFIQVNTPGQYSATVTNQCGSYTGNININQVILPYLGDDTTYCGAFSTILSTGIASTTWSTGATGAFIAVSSPGTYYAQFTNQCGSFSDSIHLYDIALTGFTNDTAYCDTSFSRVLHSGYSSTVWSTGASGESVTVSAPGTYMATVTDQCGTQTDTFIIVQNAITGLSLSASSNTVTVCYLLPDSVVLIAGVDSSSGVPVTFTWPDGQTAAQVYSSRLVADSGGIYQVTATRGQCVAVSGSDTIHTVYCDTPCTYMIAIPDAFTPNGDNKNELYTIPYSCLPSAFSIVIADRWGQTVYQSDDITRGWDGTYRGQPQPQGTYLVFVCTTEAITGKNNCRTATVNLIR